LIVLPRLILAMNIPTNGDQLIHQPPAYLIKKKSYIKNDEINSFFIKMLCVFTLSLI